MRQTAALLALLALPITLHVVIRTVECEAGRPGAVLVAASRVDESEANEKGSSIWSGLRRRLDDFRCGP